MDIISNLENETVSQIPLEAVCCVERTAPLRTVLMLLKENSHSGVLICDEEQVVGIFTERDALRTMATEVGLGDPIERHMTKRPATLAPNCAISKALLKMALGGYRRLPIVDDAGKPLGILDVEGLLYYLDQHFPSEIYNLPPKQMVCTPEADGA